MTLTQEFPATRYRDVVEDREFPTVREWRARTGRSAVGGYPASAVRSRARCSSVSASWAPSAP